MLRILTALFALSLTLTHWPASYMPSFGARLIVFPAGDKVVHFSLYMALGAWLTLALDAARGRGVAARIASLPTTLLAMCAWALLACYGLLDEATQPWVGRQLDLADWAADMAGAAVGVVSAAFVAYIGGAVAERMATARLSLAPIREFGDAARLPLRTRLLLRKLRRLGSAA